MIASDLALQSGAQSENAEHFLLYCSIYQKHRDDMTYQLQQVCMTKYNKSIPISYRLLLSPRGSTQQESERDHKRYPLPDSVQLQTSIITYHSCLYYEVIHAQLISPPMSLYLFAPSDYVQASTSAVFY